MIELLDVARNTLSGLPLINASSKQSTRPTLVLPEKFNEIVPQLKFEEQVLTYLKGDYDFDVHVENYFNPFNCPQ